MMVADTNTIMPDIPLPKPSAKPTAVGQPPAAPQATSVGSNSDNLTPPPSTLKVQPPTPSPQVKMASPTSAAPAVSPSPPPPKVAPPGSPLPVNAKPAGPPRPPASVAAVEAMTKAPPPPKPMQPEPAAAAPKMAEPKSSPLKFLPFVVGGLVLLALAAFLISRIMGGSSRQSVSVSETPSSDSSSQSGSTGTTGNSTAPTQSATLEYWGLWEPDSVMQSAFDKFEKDNPGIKINYIKQSHQDYRERLQTAIASGNGPDLFRFHASWTPMLRNELAIVPASVYSASEFKQTFFPVASEQLSLDGQLVGVPLMYDGLLLYYNQEIFEAAGVEPPTSWPELRTLASQLTVKSTDGIQRGGLAIGNATNVEHFSDILALLMLQNGADFANPNSPETRDALTFYTNFVKTDGVWSETLPSSTVAFARGEAAMMFAPSWRAHEIQAINPNLRFATTSVPQLQADQRIAWANYWAEGVSQMSKNKDAAWKLLKYLSSAATMQEMYSQQTQVREFGEPYARTDLADKLATNAILQPLMSDAPYAEGWYLSSFTHDTGINDQLIRYYTDAVNAILGGKQAADVLTTLDQGTQQVLRQYQVTTEDRGI